MTVIHQWLVDTCSLIQKKNECSPLIFEYPMATCWKSDEFLYILQPVSCSHPIFQNKKYICTFYIDIHSLKYFQSIYHSCCKVRTQFVTCKLGDCRVWTLTNPINSKPTHNSGSGVGIWTDSQRTATLSTNWQSVSRRQWYASHTSICSGWQRG